MEGPCFVDSKASFVVSLGRGHILYHHNIKYIIKTL